MNSDRIILINTPEHTNIGDHLITLAEYAFFRKYLPFYEVIEITARNYHEKSESIKQQINQSDIIAITGGGFLGSLWQSGENVPNIVKSFPDNKIIIFPQSMYFEENERGYAMKMQTKEIFCEHKNLFVCFREQYSYDRAKNIFRGRVKQFLIPDMALSLKHSKKKAGRKGVLLCLRKDKESVLSDDDKRRIIMVLNELKYEINETSMHMEVEFDYLKRGEFVEKKFDELREYSLVITDTLHCMISCFINNIPCIIFDNLTKKVEGVYRSYLRKVPYIQICTHINVFFQCLKDIQANSNCFSFIDDKVFVYEYKLLVELITGESPLRIGPAAIIKDKLYFSAMNSPGVVFEYNIDTRKIEDKFVFSVGSFFLYGHKDELWLIPKKSKVIIIFNIFDKKIVKTLPLEFLPNNIFENYEYSVFTRPLLEGNILWLSSAIGVIKIDMEKRIYYVYTYEKAGFGKYNSACTLQLVNSKLYMFGESCFIFDVQSELMEKWLDGKKLITGFVDGNRLISVPADESEKEIVITGLKGEEVYREEIPIVSLADIRVKYNYWRAIKCQELCFFVPEGGEGGIVYNIKRKEFSRWCTKNAILDVKRYKDNFLIITARENKILNFKENGELTETYVLNIPLDERLELLERYEYLTLSTEQKDQQLEMWLQQLNRIFVGKWENARMDELYSCGDEIWNETKIYLKRLES